MSSACVERYTLWGLRRFMRAAGMTQTRFVKFTSSQVPSPISDFLNIVSSRSFTPRRIVGSVDTFSRYLNRSPISSSLNARSRG